MGNKKRGFSFKAFHVDHDLCAMKVGTDGILLGAWASLSHIRADNPRILDIGTGSGLISLMLAQRCKGKGQVTAIDIDAFACEQANFNVINSPWPDAITVEHGSLQAFTESVLQSNKEKQYFDLIVSNPPYFAHGQAFEDVSRLKARHTVTLTHKELIDSALTLLAPKGVIALILPYDSACELIEYCQSLGGLSISGIKIKTTYKKSYKRMLLQVCLGNGPINLNNLIIHKEDGKYSSDFQDLTSDFYLKM